MKQRSAFYFALLAILIDIATLTIYGFISPQLVPQLLSPDGWNALLVSGTFLLMVIGVFFVRRMKATPAGSPDWLNRGTRSTLALSFAFVISLAIAWQLGFFESAFQVDTTEMGEGGAASYFVFGPGAWLAFSLIYVLVFAFRVDPQIETGSGAYWVAAITGLITAAGMLVVLAAQAEAIAQSIAMDGLWALASLLTLALLFLPPRLLYLSRTTGLRSPAAYAPIASLVLLIVALVAQFAI